MKYLAWWCRVSWLGTVPGQLGGICGQQVQLVRPELLDQRTEPAHALGIEPVIPVPPLFAGSHQACLLEQQQVLGDCGAADREVGGQLPHRLFLACQKMQKPTPVRLRCDLQGVQHN